MARYVAVTKATFYIFTSHATGETILVRSDSSIPFLLPGMPLLSIHIPATCGRARTKPYSLPLPNRAPLDIKSTDDISVASIGHEHWIELSRPDWSIVDTRSSFTHMDEFDTRN